MSTHAITPKTDTSVSAGSETLTILFCGKDCSASKKITPKVGGGVDIKGFNAGMQFGVMIRHVEGIDALSQHLTALESMPDAFVIRGSPTTEVDPAQSCRRTKENFITPEIGKRWVMIDFDKLPIPSELDLTIDPGAAIEHLVKQLPKEFHNASYHYQLSSSAGFSAPETISAHVWFWLADPWPDEKLKTWAKAVNKKAGSKLVDPALFNDVQAHYTASPIFEGVTDPFPKRSALIKKTKDAVSIREIKIPKCPASQPSGQFESGPGFDWWLACIGDHQGGDGFHEPIIKAIASYVSTHGRDDTDKEALFGIMSARVLAADRSRHDDGYVEITMAGREHLMQAIEGALQKYGDRSSSRRRSRLVTGVIPPVPKTSLSSTEAHQRLSNALDSIILGVGK